MAVFAAKFLLNDSFLSTRYRQSVGYSKQADEGLQNRCIREHVGPASVKSSERTSNYFLRSRQVVCSMASMYRLCDVSTRPHITRRLNKYSGLRHQPIPHRLSKIAKQRWQCRVANASEGAGLLRNVLDRCPCNFRLEDNRRC